MSRRVKSVEFSRGKATVWFTSGVPLKLSREASQQILQLVDLMVTAANVKPAKEQTKGGR